MPSENDMGEGENPRAAKAQRQIQELNGKVEELTAQLQKSREECRRIRDELREKEKRLLSDKRAQEQVREISEQLERQALLLEKDREVARELQRSLTPLWLSDFEGIEFALESRPGARIAGDFYDLIRLSDSAIAFLIADVSGYGLPAAVIMATARMAFRTYTGQDVSPKKIMENVNEALIQSTLAGHYLTAFLGILDTEMLTLQFANASHCCPFLLRDGEMSELDTEGLLVGMFEDPQYEEKCIEIQPKDKLFLFTDGLLRQFQGDEGNQGIDLLQAYLHDNHEMNISEMVERLSEEILQEPKDDVVLMGLEVLRKKSKEKVITIPSIPGEIMKVGDSILPILSAKGYGERNIFAVRLALEEAVVNAIKHGNELDSTKKVTIRFVVEDNAFSVSVTDEGPGFDPEEVPDPWDPDNLEAESGRGLALMGAYMDEVSYNETGNTVTMKKYAPWVPKESKSS